MLIDRLMSDPDTQWTFPQIYNLPVVLRKFFWEQFLERQEAKKKAHEQAQKSGRKW